MAIGVASDYFALGDTNWLPQTASVDPTANTAQCRDSNGDVVGETVFGQKSVWTMAYKVVGTSDTSGNITFSSKVTGGKIFAIDTNTNAVVTSLGLETSNTDYPMVTIAAEEYFGDTSTQTAYSDQFGNVLPKKAAQSVGFVADTGSRVNSASATMTLDVVQVADSDGTLKQTNAYGGRTEASGELVSCTGVASGVADTANGWATSNEVSNASDNTSPGSSTITVFKNTVGA